MNNYKKNFNLFLSKILNSKFRYIIYYTIGFNSYLSLILKISKIKGNNQAKKNIICLERSFFEKDVDQLSYRIRKYGWIWLKKDQITLYQENLIPKKFRKQTLYLKHVKKFPDKWKENIKKSKLLIKKFKDEKKACALLLANIDYWQSYSLQVACKELNIPVIVLQREYSYNEFEHTDYFKEYYKNFSPVADAIMVFGKRMKKIYSKLKGFDVNKIFVTGAPRIDRWRSLELSQSQNIELLIISFRVLNPHNNWPEKEFFQMILSISIFFGKRDLGKITIKTRNKEDSIAIRNFCNKKNLTNIELIHDVEIYDLVLQSKVIIGSNSLAIVEALFSKAPIIIPNWITKNKALNMFKVRNVISKKSVILCETKKNLLDNLEKFLKMKNSNVSKEVFETRKKFISKFWEYDKKISASHNVEKIIDNLVRD